MRKFLIAGLLAAAAAPILAQPAPPVAPVAPVAPMARMAPMADRIMTRAEVDAQVRTHFARLDTNRDGYLTAEEMAARRDDRMVRREVRKGGPGGPAAMRDPNASFDRLDANRDGAISRDEFAKGRELRIEKRVMVDNNGVVTRQPGAMPMRMRRMGGGMMRGPMLKMADANGDGRVSLAEATTGAMQHFDQVDTNRDGRITPDERRAGRIMMKQMRARQPG